MKKIFTILGISAVAMVSAQTNLVPNPGFETWAEGLPTEWFIPSNATVTQSTLAHGGASSAALEAPGSGNRTISPLNDIAVDGTKTYVFSGWYLDNTPNGRFRAWNQFRTADGDTGSNPLQMADYSVDSPEWVFFTLEGMPNAGAIVARAGLRVYPENGAGGGAVLFDDIMFYDKATMAVVDVNDFNKQVKMNTVVGDELRLVLPSKSTVNIYSVDGKLVSSNRVENGQSVNTSSLVKGAYIVTVDNGAAKISRKIIKK